MDTQTHPNPMPVQQEKQRAPLFIVVVAWILLIIGVLNLLVSGLPVLLGLIGGSSGIFITGMIMLLISIGLIVVSFGLRHMKRWGLYTYTALVVLTIVQVALEFGGEGFSILLYILAVMVAFLVCFWVISKKFI